MINNINKTINDNKSATTYCINNFQNIIKKYFTINHVRLYNNEDLLKSYNFFNIQNLEYQRIFWEKAFKYPFLGTNWGGELHMFLLNFIEDIQFSKSLEFGKYYIILRNAFKIN